MLTYEEAATRIEAKIRSMAGLGPDYKKFQHDTHIFDQGYIDSFGAVELITFLETSFGVKVLDDDLGTRPLNTVREIATLVVERSKR